MPAASASAEESADLEVKVPFTLALIAGGCAGTTVDVALYPLDTLKTRLQSSDGFWKAGGFRGIYNGVLATALGASPGSAMFFSAYEGMKPRLKQLNGGKEHWLHHSMSASCGEVAACLVRVPTAVVTQRMQVGLYKTFPEAVTKIAAENGIATFFTGYWTTVAREIPFSFIQFPLYEGLKKMWAYTQGAETSPTQGAMVGSFSGAVAAAATCPLDVVKTRMMLGAKTKTGEPYAGRGTLRSLQTIVAEEGALALFSGLGPRVGWITVGGFVFFGAYEKAQEVLWKTGTWGAKPKFEM
uniref:Mitochondrial carrier protein n=1 Tax=Haptolina brevifila TaxID=156173 RepID=A0A7S2NPY0_9EUKA